MLDWRFRVNSLLLRTGRLEFGGTVAAEARRK